MANIFMGFAHAGSVVLSNGSGSAVRGNVFHDIWPSGAIPLWFQSSVSSATAVGNEFDGSNPTNIADDGSGDSTAGNQSSH